MAHGQPFPPSPGISADQDKKSERIHASILLSKMPLLTQHQMGHVYTICFFSQQILQLKYLLISILGYLS